MRFALLPAQIVCTLPLIVTVGLLPTVTVTVFTLLHPLVFPVTVYIVVIVGDTVILEVNAPVLQV